MFAFMQKLKTLLPADRTLPGRAVQMPVPDAHFVNGHPIAPPFPQGMQTAQFAMGCFWGAERLFWQTPGVYSTAVGYAGGLTPNPTYEEVCSGLTNHAEAVLVVFDPEKVSFDALLRVFWEGHDPTQGMRQGNDVGTQYRSAAYWTTPEQQSLVEGTARAYGEVLRAEGFDPITTELAPAVDDGTVLRPFYYAEPYHQQYLYKNPHGYDCHAHTGILLPDLG
jgi:peptide-methionine (S)-S-oxide reductase